MTDQLDELMDNGGSKLPTYTREVDDLMDSYVTGRKRLLAATIDSAVKLDPNAVAHYQRVSETLGVPLDAVRSMPTLATEQAKAKALQEAIDGHAGLQRKFADADFANLASDDGHALAKVSNWFKYVTSHPDAKNTLAGDVWAGVHGANAGVAGVLRGAAELPAPLLDFMEATTPEEFTGWRGAVGGNPLRRLAEGAAMTAERSNRRADEASPPQPGLTGAFSSGIRSLAQNSLVMPMALIPAGSCSLQFLTGGVE
jgi:hypothetical protein